MELVPVGIILAVLGWIVVDLRLLRKMQREDFRAVSTRFTDQAVACNDHQRRTDLLEHMVMTEKYRDRINGGM